MTLILASASPRRHELVAHLSLDFEVVVSGIDEGALSASTPALLARRLASAKAADVASKRPDAFVLAADTIVVHRGDVLNKPADADEARTMLARLRGRRHRVITGVALVQPGWRRVSVQHTTTTVLMRPYSDEEVEAWIASGGPFDKAGAYAVQDLVFQPVQSWDGCYCNIMGLPLWTVVSMLKHAGVSVTTARMPERCDACPSGPYVRVG